MRILVRPCYSDFLRDKLFAPDHVTSTSLQTPYIRLRQRAAELGWEMSTWDMHPMESADVVYVQDLPSTREELVQARKNAPKAKFVLQLLETPLGRPAYFVKENHALFDAILTYRADLCDERRYFRYYLPVGAPESPPPKIPFAQRKPLVMVNSNRSLGVLARRQKGLQGLPFVGPMFSGWRVPIGALLSQNHGELYTRRCQIARLADRIAPAAMDVWGDGWQGEPISWIHRALPHQPYSVGRGKFNGEKHDLLPKYRFALAFENIRARVGYISEKILDPIHTGVVPIYLGDENITELIPSECFVDARKFKTNKELFDYAMNCPEPEWCRYIEAGERFRDSMQAKLFSPDYFADTVLGVLRTVTATPATPAAV
jgi:alpha(1,3/1,4) fucosyltransferase